MRLATSGATLVRFAITAFYGRGLKGRRFGGDSVTVLVSVTVLGGVVDVLVSLEEGVPVSLTDGVSVTV